MPRKILVVEDNEDLARLLDLHLRDLSYEVDLAFDGAAGWTQITKTSYDLIILDLMLPGIDGLEICRRIRAQPDYTAILMLTSKSAELDRVLGLEMGADDYVTKPFSIRELMARVKAIFRRIDKLQCYILQLSAWMIFASLLFALIAGLVLFASLTARLKRLANAMDAFRRGTGRQPILDVAPATSQ